MFDWFRKIAPIRVKMFVLIMSATAMTTIASIAALVGAAHGDTFWGLGMGVPVAAIVLVFGLGARRAICHPYVTTVERMEALAAGDLDSPIGFTDYQDCVGRLARGMVKFRDVAVNEIDRSKARLADVTILETHLTDLSHRNQMSAASLEETATSIAQMDERLKATAWAASGTVICADKAIATVDIGRAVADEAVQAMGRVLDSAKGIDSVIQGLDKIAFQTRVLAMNAAVEAGRAGPTGRGFAVVADLVSALAMRAEEEAKLARDQLTVTQADIVTAVEAVRKVDGALANISGDVGQVHDLLGTMAADNQAQSSAITQISQTIGAMDQTTQQNATMVEQSSVATRNIASDVGGLVGKITNRKAEMASSPGKPVAATPVTSRKVDARNYALPVKPLPNAGVAALVRAEAKARAL